MAKKAIETAGLSEVKAEERKSWASIAFIWAGGVCCVPALMVGAGITAGLPFGQGVLAMFLGYAICVALMVLMSILSADKGVPTVVAASGAFGKIGSGYVVSFIIAFCFICWFGFQAVVCGEAFAGILATMGLSIPGWLSTVIWGLIMCLTAVFGINWIKILNVVSVPALIVILVYAAIVVFSDSESAAAIANYKPAGSITMVSAIGMAVGGFNTFVPMLVAILSDKDPDKRIKFIDMDSNGRAVPELNTTLSVYYGHPPKPLGLGSLNGDEIVVYPVTDHSGEQIARNMCMLYNMRIGFATWGLNKAEMKDLDVGCVTKAQNIGKAFFAARDKGTDLMDELKKVMEVREFCRGTIEELDVRAEGGFDWGTTVVRGDDGHKYYIDFKNENLILRDEAGKTCLTAPDGIGLVDLDTLTPLTNADTKVGMRLPVSYTHLTLPTTSRV